MSVPTLLLSRVQTRAFSLSSTSKASVLFALGALSNSRETQHFNKLSRLERFEHSPNLKLIKTSEIDPFPVPIERLLQNAPTSSLTQQVAIVRSAFRRRQEVGTIWDRKALQAGRAILAQTATERGRLARTVARLRQREGRQNTAIREQLAALEQERKKMSEEMRSAGFLILLSIGVATGIGMWTFWPVKEGARDSAEMGRRIAEKARRSIPLPAVSTPGAAVPTTSVSTSEAVVAAGAGAVPASAVVTGEPTVAPAVVLEESVKPAAGWTWRSLLWKRS